MEYALLLTHLVAQDILQTSEAKNVFFLMKFNLTTGVTLALPNLKSPEDCCRYKQMLITVLWSNVQSIFCIILV